MNKFDAIKKATEFLRQHTGVTPEPESAAIIKRPDRRYWSVVYRQEAFFPEKTADGVIMDGPYVLRVDDNTGDVVVEVLRPRSRPSRAIRRSDQMLKSFEGIYRHGKTELLESPPANVEGMVIVTFLAAGAIDLAERGIDEQQAADLRHRLKPFADD